MLFLRLKLKCPAGPRWWLLSLSGLPCAREKLFGNLISPRYVQLPGVYVAHDTFNNPLIELLISLVPRENVAMRDLPRRS